MIGTCLGISLRLAQNGRLHKAMEASSYVHHNSGLVSVGTCAPSAVIARDGMHAGKGRRQRHSHGIKNKVIGNSQNFRGRPVRLTECQEVHTRHPIKQPDQKSIPSKNCGVKPPNKRTDERGNKLLRGCALGATAYRRSAAAQTTESAM